MKTVSKLAQSTNLVVTLTIVISIGRWSVVGIAIQICSRAYWTAYRWMFLLSYFTVKLKFDRIRKRWGRHALIKNMKAPTRGESYLYQDENGKRARGIVKRPLDYESDFWPSEGPPPPMRAVISIEALYLIRTFISLHGISSLLFLEQWFVHAF